ncbi:transcriptional regulator, TetR family [Alteromonadaceae bacterium Bs31]|nr:transcriptional regulator, TetR family [Alteromonadaceae bacterium Bs31]
MDALRENRSVGILAWFSLGKDQMTPQRDPESTRAALIEVAAEEFTTRGYEGASLSEIISKAEVSKGGLYHHFSSKQALAYAVFDEVFLPTFLHKWDDALEQDDPAQALYEKISRFIAEVTPEMLAEGCPMIKMAMELGQIDPGIRDRVHSAFTSMRNRFLDALTRAQLAGSIKASADPRAAAAFIVASFQGLSLQAQHSGDVESFQAGGSCLADFILSLKH